MLDAAGIWINSRILTSAREVSVACTLTRGVDTDIGMATVPANSAQLDHRLNDFAAVKNMEFWWSKLGNSLYTNSILLRGTGIVKEHDSGTIVPIIAQDTACTPNPSSVL